MATQSKQHMDYLDHYAQPSTKKVPDSIFVDHIDKIIFYLRNNQNFKKYNKFIYAFRLEQPNNQTFITAEMNAR